MKPCSKCELVKNESDFSKDKYRKDGLRSQCKSCMKEYQQSKAGKRADRKYSQTSAGKEKSRKRSNRYRKRHPERVKAVTILNNAIRDGRIFKKPCPCGKTKVEGHHEDYNKPLDVEWLCKKCHTKKYKRRK